MRREKQDASIAFFLVFVLTGALVFVFSEMHHLQTETQQLAKQVNAATAEMQRVTSVLEESLQAANDSANRLKDTLDNSLFPSVQALENRFAPTPTGASKSDSLFARAALVLEQAKAIRQELDLAKRGSGGQTLREALKEVENSTTKVKSNISDTRAMLTTPAPASAPSGVGAPSLRDALRDVDTTAANAKSSVAAIQAAFGTTTKADTLAFSLQQVRDPIYNLSNIKFTDWPLIQKALDSIIKDDTRRTLIQDLAHISRHPPDLSPHPHDGGAN